MEEETPVLGHEEESMEVEEEIVGEEEVEREDVDVAEEEPHTSVADEDIATSGEPSNAAMHAPKKIKRPSSAWIIYLAQNRPLVKAEHPEFGFKELSQTLSERFKALSPDEKKVYDDLAAADKQRWQKEVELYGHLEVPPEDSSSEIIFPMVAATYNNYVFIYIQARVRKTMKLDPDVKNVQKDGVVVMSKCLELFIAHMAHASKNVSRSGRTIKINDVVDAIHSRSELQFLKLDFPRDMIPSVPPVSSAPKKVPASSPVKGKPITAFFNSILAIPSQDQASEFVDRKE